MLLVVFFLGTSFQGVFYFFCPPPPFIYIFLLYTLAIMESGELAGNCGSDGSGGNDWFPPTRFLVLLHDSRLDARRKVVALMTLLYTTFVYPNATQSYPQSVGPRVEGS